MAMGKGGALDVLGIGGLGKPGKIGPAEDSPMGIKERAIQDFWDAKDSKDVKAGAAAFQRAYDACAMAHSEEGDEYPEE